MSHAADQRLAAAKQRFVRFFTELEEVFIEREELLMQIALALLSREHVLMTGPPGTAKSGIASAVLRRVVDETTREPSLFARQFTESTVQTDLVGPINFKTLMESGRTEHFTDEGMLGAVHAFLDEVFDGRDMLLRSTLNVLHERELKQGTRTTRGEIECALMTTNRYLAEVLEGSRETLLAFVDRIAFVAFVPKGFADPTNLATVLKRQVQPKSRLRAELTIQDLDVLQDLVDHVPVPDEILAGLAAFLASFERELSDASRSDPDFLPTRYLSTRSAVRLGRTLRAICVYDQLFNHPDRALEVRGDDLRATVLSLTLSGPKGDTLSTLLAKEADPRERRQLSIIRTEREAFERALASVLPIAVKERPAPVEDKTEAQRAPDPSSLRTERLAELARSTTTVEDSSSSAMLERVVVELTDRTLRAHVSSLGPSSTDCEQVLQELVSLADQIDDNTPFGQDTARWLRTRALWFSTRLLELTTVGSGAMLDQLRAPPTGILPAVSVVEERLTRLDRFDQLRQRLLAVGVDDGREAHESAWAHMLQSVELEAAAILDLGFQRELGSAIAAHPNNELEGLLQALTGPLDLLRAMTTRLVNLGLAASALRCKVVSPRILPLMEATFARMAVVDRVKLVEQVDALLSVLHAHDLRDVLDESALVRLVAEAVVRSTEAHPVPSLTPLARERYRTLRDEDLRVPGAFTLLDVALRLVTFSAAADTEHNATALAALARALPAELADTVTRLDIERIERAVAFLERWGDEVLSVSGTAEERLQSIAASGYVHALTDEQALLRLSLEMELVSNVFPAARDPLEGMLERLRSVEHQAEAALRDVLTARANEAWASDLPS